MRIILSIIILVSFFGCKNPESTGKQKDAFKKKKDTINKDQNKDDCVGCGNE